MALADTLGLITSILEANSLIIVPLCPPEIFYVPRNFIS